MAKELTQFFPADFICEAVDQTRGWFYTLLAISVLLKQGPAYRNVICLGHVLDEKGQKMSKSKGNIIKPSDIFDAMGADAIRWHFLTDVAPGHSRRLGKIFDRQHPLHASQSFLNTIRNSVNFFILYARADGLTLAAHNPVAFCASSPDSLDPPSPLGSRKDAKKSGVQILRPQPLAERSDFDQWLAAHVEKTSEDVHHELKNYQSRPAGLLLIDLVDSISNWYIRRNRRRFWQRGLNQDKINGYATLYDSLLRLAQMLAPFVPFIAEDIYQALVVSQRTNLEQMQKAMQMQIIDRTGSHKQEASQERSKPRKKQARKTRKKFTTVFT